MVEYMAHLCPDTEERMYPTSNHSKREGQTQKRLPRPNVASLLFYGSFGLDVESYEEGVLVLTEV